MDRKVVTVALACLAGIAGFQVMFLTFTLVVRQIMPFVLTEEEIEGYDEQIKASGPISKSVWIGAVIALALLVTAIVIWTS